MIRLYETQESIAQPDPPSIQPGYVQHVQNQQPDCDRYMSKHENTPINSNMLDKGTHA